jgi:homoaconitase/3-isopropylmalate dehydratase large subunit
MGQTIAEKIFSRACGRPVQEGDIVYPEPDLVTTHDWYVVNFDKVMQELGIDRLHAPHKLLISTDHEPVATSPLAAQRQREAEAVILNDPFVQKMMRQFDAKIVPGSLKPA